MIESSVSGATSSIPNFNLTLLSPSGSTVPRRRRAPARSRSPTGRPRPALHPARVLGLRQRPVLRRHLRRHRPCGRAASAGAERPGRADARLGVRRRTSVQLGWTRAGLERRLGDHGLQGLPRHRERRRDAARDARHRHDATPTRRRANGTTYFYKVSAVNGVGEGALSNERSATGDAPTVPARRPDRRDRGQRRRRARVERAGLERRLGDHGLQGLPRHLERRRDAARRRSAPARATPTRPSPTATTYFYAVSAVNAVGEGAQSNERSATPPTVPAAPTLNAPTAGNGLVTLAWSAPRERRLRDHGLQALPRHLERQRDAARDARHRHELHRHGRQQRHDLLLRGRRATNAVGDSAPSRTSARPRRSCRRTRRRRRSRAASTCSSRAPTSSRSTGRRRPTTSASRATRSTATACSCDTVTTTYFLDSGLAA